MDENKNELVIKETDESEETVYKLEKSEKKKNIIIISLCVSLLLLIAGGVAAYYYSVQFSKKDDQKKVNEVSKMVDNTPEISWQEPQIVSSLKIFAGDDGYGFSREKGAKYYTVGKYTKGDNKAAEIILATAPFNGPVPYPGYYRLVKKGDNLTLLTRYSEKIYDGDGVLTNKFKLDSTTVVPGLDYPESLVGTDAKQKLTRDVTVREFFSLTNLKKSFADQKYGDVYTTESMTNSNSILDKYGFYLRAADNTTVAYYYKAEYMNDQGVASITWNNGSVNKDKYAFGDANGCGRKNYATVVSDDHLANSKTGGRTSTGDSVYDNTNTYELQDFYNNKYTGDYDYSTGKSTKVSYQVFVAGHPLILWKDPFGRVIQLENLRFIPALGCGKPVIYLYPKETTKVSVRLVPQGGFTKTEPAYNGGWEVLADKFGNLTDLVTGKTYPYLFWEGYGGLYTEPEKGFVVKKDEVHKFLIEKLKKFALNDKEINDFLEFWEPKMKSSPYYFVSFWGNQEMDRIAPLEISPKPDTMIRVLMDYRPLDKPISVQGYEIRTLERKGFTVIEWGGVLK